MRVRRRLRTPALIALLACFIALQPLVTWPFPSKSTLDLGALWASGYAYRQGLSPYIDPNTVVSVAYPLGSPNANPPVSLLLFVPLSLLPLEIAQQVMYYGSLAFYLLCVALLACRAQSRPSPRRLAWALAMTAPWYTLQYGQIYVLLFPLAAGAWQLLSAKRYVAAGLLMGALAAVKPNLALWPALLLLGGYWTAGLTAGLAAMGLSVTALAAFGPSTYRDWLALGGTRFLAKASMLPTDMSLPALTTWLGIPWAAYPLALALLAGVAWIAWRLRPRVEALSALAIVIALLASPRAWVGYTILLLPLFLLSRWTWPLRAAAGLLLVPFWLVIVVADISTPVSAVAGCVYPLALLLLLVHCVQVVRASHAPHAPQPFPCQASAGLSGDVTPQGECDESTQNCDAAEGTSGQIVMGSDGV